MMPGQCLNGGCATHATSPNWEVHDDGSAANLASSACGTSSSPPPSSSPSSSSSSSSADSDALSFFFGGSAFASIISRIAGLKGFSSFAKPSPSRAATATRTIFSVSEPF